MLALIIALSLVQHPHDEPVMRMQMTDPLGISMERLGSGTTWIPDAVPLPSRHYMAGPWMFMVHGIGFVQYDNQGGPRGDDQLGSLNWAMLMVSRDVGGGRIQARTMLSLDPATVTARGYPLLLQNGETHNGEPLVDRQHPHDFWMELALMYERALTRELGITAYVAPAGEPALGPVAFMHRPSAMDNPIAPLGHHWQDATHISFGVITMGVFGHHWKLEGSVFNGREPDEERWGFDRIRLDSYSARFSAHLDSSWTLAAGYGYLKSPEALDPNEPTRRATASVLHGRSLGRAGQLAAAVVWGTNRHQGRSTHSVLAEAEAVLDPRNTVYGRLEFVQKSAEDLVLAGFAAESTFRVNAFSLGYIREVLRTRGATVGVGVQGTVNAVPAPLESAYGSRTPVGSVIFLRIRPLHASHTSAEPRMSDHH